MYVPRRWETEGRTSCRSFIFTCQTECFPDDIGYDLPDIAAAHARAKRLANLVMTTSRLSSYPFDWRRWSVTVATDDSQGAILIIPFSAFGNATRAALSAFVPADRAVLSAPGHK